MLAKTKITKPDIVELTLTIILVLWAVVVSLLIKSATANIGLLTVESLTMFFSAFLSIIVIVLAILIADIRKEIKKIY
jgi:hypothetical protein